MKHDLDEWELEVLYAFRKIRRDARASGRSTGTSCGTRMLLVEFQTDASCEEVKLQFLTPGDHRALLLAKQSRR